MATATIAPDQDVICAEIFIAAAPERVFQAITDPEQMPKWWGQQGMYRITEYKADLRPGGKWSIVGDNADGSPFRVDGEYLEVDPPRLLVHTWIASWTGSLKTIVRWELEARGVHALQHHRPQKIGTGTAVRIMHSGFAEKPDAVHSHSQGWIHILGWMQSFVEKGETLDKRGPI
ncbi:MAG TPA: SRPBCC domain-containing protein [Candidatus Sulfotelmatobacter sp.]|nr:SRPBCC domain-containing protein [Candidatus Sulfotelmatobacter sp.]